VADEEVGYGRPPKHSQLKKGQSGNPNGRPKGSLNIATVLERTLRETVVINENGQRKTITKLEAAVKQLVNKAASGDMNAFKVLSALAHSAEEQDAAQDAEEAQNLKEVDQKILQDILKRFGNSEPKGE
jgi:hypothetical protein